MTEEAISLFEWKYGQPLKPRPFMRPYEFEDFKIAINQCQHQFQFRSETVKSATWQGVNISEKPEMAMHELTHVSFGVPLKQEDLDYYRWDIKPNLPWADNHFEERVCGSPINPGWEWQNWPYGKSAATFLWQGQFNHNYMERYWPKQAGRPKVPTFNPADWKEKFEEEQQAPVDAILPNSGIRHHSYGDLNDVIQLLCSDPLTRQAYLPVWFPEDTGGGNKRAPCSIGYHFLMRNGKLDINYEIRSCDFIRHFRDDLYLTVRLLLWVLDECRKRDPNWNSISPGKFFIQIGSFHMFRNDYIMLFGSDKKAAVDQRV